jgi:hypothetical protein
MGNLLLLKIITTLTIALTVRVYGHLYRCFAKLLALCTPAINLNTLITAFVVDFFSPEDFVCFFGLFAISPIKKPAPAATQRAVGEASLS